MSIAETFTPSQQAQSFVDSVDKGTYDRQITAGIGKFVDKKVPEDMQGFYTDEQLGELVALKGTDRDIESRMPVKITRHYFEQAKNSAAMRQLIKASPDETFDLAGSPDPGNQMHYSPCEGLIHKYELGLIYVASTCSAHCRFCYREELIARKDVVRPNGEVAPKGLAQVEEICDYVQEHNRLVEANGGRHPETGRERLREILMSGGDPMVLTNKKLATWWSSLSEAGVESIRIGTKELAFYPDRFDAAFFDMLDRFHQLYPQTKLRFVVHFNHPDEFLKKNEDGSYIEDPRGGLVWLDNTLRSVQRLASRHWVNIDNQSPIIRGINNDPDVLRIMQRELKRNRVENHYFFCGRDIVGHRAFNVPIEEAWRILNESQKGLSGVEAHARLSITHYRGKTEVVTVTNESIPGVAASGDGFVIFKLMRSVEDARHRGKVSIVGRNPEAIWFNDYEDRVIMDEAGLFPKSAESNGKY
ncbi:MAG: KamA family radical SAM protein [Pirellulaceae bacterium]